MDLSFSNLAVMAKKKESDKKYTPKKPKGIQHNASFEELMRLAATTQKKKKK